LADGADNELAAAAGRQRRLRRPIATARRASTSGRRQYVHGFKANEPSLIARSEEELVGIGELGPWMKHKPTPLAPAAIETIASDGRSVGP